MQEVIPEPIVRAGTGIEVGCGCGYDAAIMAQKNPSVKIISTDISDGVFTAKGMTAGLNNVEIIKSSVLEAPFKNSVFDFVYSFGVLHHTPSPKQAISEIARILKKDSPVFLYLYEDHSENPIKYIAVKALTFIRRLTVRIPAPVLYRLAWVFSPFVYAIFTIPAKILKKFETTREFAGKIPFNFGSGFFSLRGDIYDRFSAPIEYRFSRRQVFDMLSGAGFFKITITRLRDTSGWVAWGYKQ